MAAGRPELLAGLPPIIDAGVRTLILGSFPSPASLAAAHYYAHRQNQFWRLLEALLDEPLCAVDYPAKQQSLLRRRIGLWDVYGECRRRGALDAPIESAVANDFSRLRDAAPQLSCVCFNGQTAGRFAGWFRRQGYATQVLPSSSPAYTLAFADKLVAWRAAIPDNVTAA